MPSLPLTCVLLIDDDSTANFLHQLLLKTTLRVAEQVLVAENGQEARAQQLSVDAFLPKPLTREKVQALLQQYFSAA